jgi:ABC-2 type transport system ATP-binding protein
MALVGDPALLVLDEPTTGLDPDGIAEMRSLIDDVSDRGCTVFLSSHRLGEVAATCDRVGVLHDGQIQSTTPVSNGRLAELTDEVVVSLSVSGDPTELAAALRDEDSVDSVSVDGPWVTATCPSTAARVAAVETALSTATVTDLRAERTSLETLFDQTVHGGGS